jgi:hypothetical protein
MKVQLVRRSSQHLTLSGHTARAAAQGSINALSSGAEAFWLINWWNDRIYDISTAKSDSLTELDDKDCDDPGDQRQNTEEVSESNGVNRRMEEVRDGPPQTSK